jgi:hypothetical protein
VLALNIIGTCESPSYTLWASLVIDIMRGFARALVDLVLQQACVGMARTHPPHDPNAPLQLCGPHQRTNLTSGTVPAFLRLLKAYRPSAAQSITVGVVGFPNVGKSSLINSLKRAKVHHRIRFEPEMFIKPLLTARRHEGVCRCTAAGTHEGTAVHSTRAWPADHRLAGGQF